MLALKEAVAGARPCFDLGLRRNRRWDLGGASPRPLVASYNPLSAAHQTIVITHLPQIASLADQHFSVRKQQVQQRTHHRGRATRRQGPRRRKLPICWPAKTIFGYSAPTRPRNAAIARAMLAQFPQHPAGSARPLPTPLHCPRGRTAQLQARAPADHCRHHGHRRRLDGAALRPSLPASARYSTRWPIKFFLACLLGGLVSLARFAAVAFWGCCLSATWQSYWWGGTALCVSQGLVIAANRWGQNTRPSAWYLRPSAYVLEAPASLRTGLGLAAASLIVVSSLSYAQLALRLSRREQKKLAGRESVGLDQAIPAQNRPRRGGGGWGVYADHFHHLEPQGPACADRLLPT